jgi:hypothetical protein
MRTHTYTYKYTYTHIYAQRTHTHTHTHAHIGRGSIWGCQPSAGSGTRVQKGRPSTAPNSPGWCSSAEADPLHCPLERGEKSCHLRANQTYTHTNTHTQTRTHAHTHARTHALSRKYACTHARSLVQQKFWPFFLGKACATHFLC